MKTLIPSTIPPELMAELQETAEKAAKGIRDFEAMRKACENMDRIREEIRKRHGVLDIGVPTIRELRQSQKRSCRVAKDVRSSLDSRPPSAAAR